MKLTWLAIFSTVMKIVEAAGRIVAPIVAAAGSPIVAALILQGTNALVGAETLITTPGSGAEKAALVRAQTEATVALINEILAAQKKPLLPANITDIVQQQVQVVVGGLNTVQQAVEAAK